MTRSRTSTRAAGRVGSDRGGLVLVLVLRLGLALGLGLAWLGVLDTPAFVAAASSVPPAPSAPPAPLTPCEAGDCRTGRCSFADCREPVECGGGRCVFERCFRPSCRGGGCTFLSCAAPTCRGGQCNFVNPTTTLKRGFCSGGNCELDGVRVNDQLGTVLSV